MIMTKAEAKKRQAELKSRIESHLDDIKSLNSVMSELEAIINKKDDWKDKLVQPNKGEEFYYLRDRHEDGLGIGYYYRNTQAKPEHAFRTQAQAELVKDKMLLMQEMHAFAHVRNEGWIADWRVGIEKKFGVFYNTYDGLKVVSSVVNNDFVFGVAVKSKEIAEEMLEEFRERISEVYIKQY